MSRGRFGPSGGFGTAGGTRRSRTIIWSRCRLLVPGRGTASGGSKFLLFLFLSLRLLFVCTGQDADVVVLLMP